MLSQLYNSLFPFFLAPYAVAYSFVSNLIILQSKMEVEQLTDLIENELIKKREKRLSVRSVSSTDLRRQLLVARDRREFPARPRRTSFSEATYSCTELGAILQYILRKTNTRVMTGRCNKLEKLSDQKLFILNLLHKQNNDCFLQRLSTYRTQSRPLHQICRIPILELAFPRAVSSSRMLLHLKQLSHNFKQCHIHEDWVSHLPRNQLAICKLPFIS